MTIVIPSYNFTLIKLYMDTRREDGEIPSLPRSCEWERNLQLGHCPPKGWDGKVGESRTIHESENLTSNLKAFRGEDDWLRNFLCDPISLIGVWGFLGLSIMSRTKGLNHDVGSR